MMKQSAIILALVFFVTACSPDADNGTAVTNQKQPANVVYVANTPDNRPEKQPPADPLPPPEPESGPQIEAEYIAFEGGLRAYPERRVVEMDAWLLGAQTRPLEYLLVSPAGNTHESLFATAASGLHLKRALEIIMLSEGETKRAGRGYLEKPIGDRVKLSVRFRHNETGETTVAPVEDWLWDHHRDQSLSYKGFIFIGSFEQYRPELNRSLFEADMKGNIIALWRDASCVLDNDRENAWRPDIYSPYPDADGIPQRGPGGSPQVVLLFEPWQD